MSLRHDERAHAVWAPSASEANFNCAGRIALIDLVQPEDTSSEAADWGTAAHELSEWSLRAGRDPLDFAESAIKVNGRRIVVDEELRETAQCFVDYVNRRVAEYKSDVGTPPDLHIEKRVHYLPEVLPLRCHGLGDCILVFPSWKEIEVVDLKGGFWYVDHVRNKQLGTYGVAAIDEGIADTSYKLRTTIVQPRAIGCEEVRDYLWPVDEIEDHRERLRTANFAAFDVREKVRKATSPEERAELLQEALQAGEHCKFCPVSGVCSARAAQSLEKARTFFKPLGIPAPPVPATLSNDQIADVLDAAEMLRDWLSTVERYALSLVEGGHTLTGRKGRYLLQNSYGRRAFTEPDALEELALCYGLPLSELYENRPKTPAQVEKVLKRYKIKNWPQVMKDLADKPLKGASLVREDARTHPESAPKVHQFFKAIEDKNG